MSHVGEWEGGKEGKGGGGGGKREKDGVCRSHTHLRQRKPPRFPCGHVCDGHGEGACADTTCSWIYCHRCDIQSSAHCLTCECSPGAAWGCPGSYRSAGRWGTAGAQSCAWSLGVEREKSRQPWWGRQAAATAAAQQHSTSRGQKPHPTYTTNQQPLFHL